MAPYSALTILPFEACVVDSADSLITIRLPVSKNNLQNIRLVRAESELSKCLAMDGAPRSQRLYFFFETTLDKLVKTKNNCLDVRAPLSGAVFTSNKTMLESAMMSTSCREQTSANGEGCYIYVQHVGTDGGTPRFEWKQLTSDFRAILRSKCNAINRAAGIKRQAAQIEELTQNKKLYIAHLCKLSSKEMEGLDPETLSLYTRAVANAWLSTAIETDPSLASLIVNLDLDVGEPRSLPSKMKSHILSKKEVDKLPLLVFDDETGEVKAPEEDLPGLLTAVYNDNGLDGLIMLKNVVDADHCKILAKEAMEADPNLVTSWDTSMTTGEGKDKGVPAKLVVEDRDKGDYDTSLIVSNHNVPGSRGRLAYYPIPRATRRNTARSSNFKAAIGSQTNPPLPFHVAGDKMFTAAQLKFPYFKDLATLVERSTWSDVWWGHVNEGNTLTFHHDNIGNDGHGVDILSLNVRGEGDVILRALGVPIAKFRLRPGDAWGMIEGRHFGYKLRTIVEHGVQGYSESETGLLRLSFTIRRGLMPSA